MADAVLSAKAGQKTPEGFYSIERMLKRVMAGEGQVLLCGTCMDARGIAEAELMEGARRSTMDELAVETLQRTRRSCSDHDGGEGKANSLRRASRRAGELTAMAIRNV